MSKDRMPIAYGHSMHAWRKQALNNFKYFKMVFGLRVSGFCFIDKKVSDARGVIANLCVFYTFFATMKISNLGFDSSIPPIS